MHHRQNADENVSHENLSSITAEAMRLLLASPTPVMSTAPLSQPSDGGNVNNVLNQLLDDVAASNRPSSRLSHHDSDEKEENTTSEKRTALHVPRKRQSQKKIAAEHQRRYSGVGSAAVEHTEEKAALQLILSGRKSMQNELHQATKKEARVRTEGAELDTQENLAQYYRWGLALLEQVTSVKEHPHIQYVTTLHHLDVFEMMYGDRTTPRRRAHPTAHDSFFFDLAQSLKTEAENVHQYDKALNDVAWKTLHNMRQKELALEEVQSFCTHQPETLTGIYESFAAPRPNGFASWRQQILKWDRQRQKRLSELRLNQEQNAREELQEQREAIEQMKRKNNRQWKTSVARQLHLIETGVIGTSDGDDVDSQRSHYYIGDHPDHVTPATSSFWGAHSDDSSERSLRSNPLSGQKRMTFRRQTWVNEETFVPRVGRSPLKKPPLAEKGVFERLHSRTPTRYQSQTDHNRKRVASLRRSPSATRTGTDNGKAGKGGSASRDSVVCAADAGTKSPPAVSTMSDLEQKKEEEFARDKNHTMSSYYRGHDRLLTSILSVPAQGEDGVCAASCDRAADEEEPHPLTNVKLSRKVIEASVARLSQPRGALDRRTTLKYAASSSKTNSNSSFAHPTAERNHADTAITAESVDGAHARVAPIAYDPEDFRVKYSHVNQRVTADLERRRRQRQGLKLSQQEADELVERLLLAPPTCTSSVHAATIATPKRDNIDKTPIKISISGSDDSLSSLANIIHSEDDQRVTPSLRALSCTSRTTFLQRQAAYQQAKEQKRRNLMREKGLAEAAACTFTPRVNPNSARLVSDHGHLNNATASHLDHYSYHYPGRDREFHAPQRGRESTASTTTMRPKSASSSSLSRPRASVRPLASAHPNVATSQRTRKSYNSHDIPLSSSSSSLSLKQNIRSGSSSIIISDGGDGNPATASSTSSSVIMLGRSSSTSSQTRGRGSIEAASYRRHSSMRASNRRRRGDSSHRPQTQPSIESQHRVSARNAGADEGKDIRHSDHFHDYNAAGRVPRRTSPTSSSSSSVSPRRTQSRGSVGGILYSDTVEDDEHVTEFNSSSSPRSELTKGNSHFGVHGAAVWANRHHQTTDERVFITHSSPTSSSPPAPHHHDHHDQYYHHQYDRDNQYNDDRYHHRSVDLDHSGDEDGGVAAVELDEGMKQDVLEWFQHIDTAGVGFIEPRAACDAVLSFSTSNTATSADTRDKKKKYERLMARIYQRSNCVTPSSSEHSYLRKRGNDDRAVKVDYDTFLDLFTAVLMWE